MSPQQSIAHYRIISKLGEGGMGEVWRATDTKLSRDVAIKVLPATFAADSDRLARFAREAQVLASLNHPNIAAIYGVEERALVMELVDGPTLADRIARGPIPLDEAVPIARQIAEALEYAHERGVIHRDLKPANIKIAPEGRAKVLDFGLAKAISSKPSQLEAGATISPTLTMQASQVGIILGTAAYMSPEQARGQEADRRSDIWAFGVVLYEMLTGRQLFSGQSVSDTLAEVLKGDLDLSAAPMAVRLVVERCLRREPQRRWQAIGDARIALEEGPPIAAAPAPVAAMRRSAIPWITVAALAVIAGGALNGWWRARLINQPLIRLSVDLGPEAMPGLNLTAAISPDGRRLVFPARGPDGKQQLATRLLDQAFTTLLPGTESGHDPFFSPDSQWIGFISGRQIKRVSVQGGTAALVSSGLFIFGGSWAEDGSIIVPVSATAPLTRIPFGGATPQELTKLGPGDSTHRWPQILPGGDAVLFTASSSTAGIENANIEAMSLKHSVMKLVQRGGYYGRYLPSGHLVYMRQGVLYGVRFDLERLEPRGSPVPLLDDLAANPLTGGGQFDFSNSGTFVYAAGKSAAPAWRLAWLDSSGNMKPLSAPPGAYTSPRFSPDGRKVAYLDSGGDIQIYDLARDTTARLTFTGGIIVFCWAPDGRHILSGSGTGLQWIRSDGSGGPQRLLDNLNSPRPWSISGDGRFAAYYDRSSDTGFDIWTFALDLRDPDHPKAGKPEPFLRTAADEMIPIFSHDGRWIAYRSIEAGSPELYVRPFPATGGGRWQISSGGGLYPRWSPSGHELLYETIDNRIMAVEYTVDAGSFIAGRRRVWSEKPLFYTGSSNFDLAPDGKRLVVFSPIEAAAGEKGSVHVTMLLNFFDEVRRKLP
jgi:serine/threonine-protein kinase